MDFSDFSRAVFNRIHRLEPENGTKIIGYLLLHDHSEQDMIRLAHGPENLIHVLIHRAKIELGLIRRSANLNSVPSSMNSAPTSDLPFTPFSSASPRPFPSRNTFHAPYLEPQPVFEPPLAQNSNFIPYESYPDFTTDDLRTWNQIRGLNYDDQLEAFNLGVTRFPDDDYYTHNTLGGARAGQRSSSLTEFPVKSCLYHNRGFCKHGDNCRFFHGQSSLDNFNPVFSLPSQELVDEDHVSLPGSLEELELEIVELLKSRRGYPVSIASLPSIYCETYGKVLQAEGYLTESQRHGKAGYSLTKLLARLKNSIRLIDRPHGQHSVMLAEDAPRYYLENRNERSDPGPIVCGSRQIYLTFPAESTFTEEDVSNYFATFGPVEDVRIPCQQKRMFGFVTFVSSDTVKVILSKGNPHFVCGSRVLVKPYREKTKHVDRNYLEKTESALYYSPDFLDIDYQLHSKYETSRLMRKQLMEEHERALELERRRLSQLKLVRKPVANQLSFGRSMNELKVPEGLLSSFHDHSMFPSVERFSDFLDVMNNSSTVDDKIWNTGTNNIDHESQGLDLPESPFSSTATSSVSAII